MTTAKIKESRRIYAARTAEEQRAWNDRILRIRKRADAALMRHGATAEDIDESIPLAIADGAWLAVVAFVDALTPAQWEALAPAAETDRVTLGAVRCAVIDLWQALVVEDGQAAMFDFYVPIAEALWPEVER